MEVRLAQPADCPGIAEIENREILEGFAHFGTSPVTADSVVAALQASTHPWFVAVEGNDVLGFCRSSPWKARESYSRTCEIGVYVRPEIQGRGVGRALYGELFPELKQRGLHTILAGIALPNPGSIRLHERFGMIHVGTLPQVGFKFGEWRDVGYWARVLGA